MGVCINRIGTVRTIAFERAEAKIGLANLERFLTLLNLRGFPWVGDCDSRCGLVKEASLHDETSFD